MPEMLDSTASRPRVRFAPSPTGFLHVGSARTFIFNWLYARHHGGTVILRLDDTDVERNTQASVDSIFDGLKWLDLSWDEEYKQSERLDLHRKIAWAIFEKGFAYRDFTPAHAGEAEKSGAQGTWLFNPGARELSPAESERRAAAGEPFALRFRVPRESGQLVRFADAVYGEQIKSAADIEDFALLRSDGMPTYHLASCADDADLRISHIIRGQDHLSNTFKHVLIFEAAGVKPPQFAHLPLLVAPDGTKLSKRRHGPVVSVTTYRNAGFLSEAFINFLCLLGWSPKNDRENMSLQELTDVFSLEGINRSNAVVNFKEPATADNSAHNVVIPSAARDLGFAASEDTFDPKALWLNAEHIRSLPVDDLSAHLLPIVQGAGFNITTEKMLKITPLIRERIKLLRDVLTATDFFFVDQLPPYDPAELIPQKGDAAMALKVLTRAREVLANVEFKHDPLDQALRAAAQELGVKAGQMFQPIRVAVCGRKNAPPLFETLEVLGRETTLARLEQAIQKVEPFLPPQLKWDVFISYASENSRTARAIANELRRYDLGVWFAPLVLEVGDSLREKIDQGLANCRYGVVVLSKPFFRKQWPQWELNALFARQALGSKVLLPVRHGITQKEMLTFSPMLTDVFSANTRAGVRAVAEKLVKVIKPEAAKIHDAFRAVGEASSRISERIQEIDPRVYARVETGLQKDPRIVEPRVPPPPGILASFFREGVRVDLFAHDPRGFNEKPWRIKGELSREGARKLEEFQRTGERTVLSAAEATLLLEPISKLFPGSITAETVLDTSPLAKARRHQFRVTFLKDDRRVEYPLVEFGAESVGKEQVRIVSRATNIPIKMDLTLRVSSGTAGFKFSGSFLGHEIRDIAKAQNALDIARSGGSIELFDLASDRLLTRLDAAPDADAGSAQAQKEEFISSFVQQAHRVAVTLDKRIVWNRELRPDDVENTAVLSQIVTAGTLQVSADDFRATVDQQKLEQLSTLAKNRCGGVFHREGGEIYPVFDVPIDPGPHDIYFLPSEVIAEQKVSADEIRVMVKLNEPLGLVFPQYYPGPQR
jgi:glutamyl-tRNA synthetase